jgi:hypothetical protein
MIILKPLELMVERWANYPTFLFSLLLIEVDDLEGCLFRFGWYQGHFNWDLLYWRFIEFKIDELRSKE